MIQQLFVDNFGYMNDREDYKYFKGEISGTDRIALKQDDIDIYAENLTIHVIEIAKKHIPNKTINVRTSGPSWLTTHVKKKYDKTKTHFKQI